MRCESSQKVSVAAGRVAGNGSRETAPRACGGGPALPKMRAGLVAHFGGSRIRPFCTPFFVHAKARPASEHDSDLSAIDRQGGPGRKD